VSTHPQLVRPPHPAPQRSSRRRTGRRDLHRRRTRRPSCLRIVFFVGGFHYRPAAPPKKHGPGFFVLFLGLVGVAPCAPFFLGFWKGVQVMSELLDKLPTMQEAPLFFGGGD
jgi:hypothetical protein